LPLCGIPDGGLQSGDVGDARQSTAAGGHRQTDTLHGFISRLYFTASSARHNKYCPIIEIPVSGAFHAFGSGPSIEFSASLKYTSYAPLKIINGKYQNSNGTSNSYL
jgi:hypothetical protein